MSMGRKDPEVGKDILKKYLVGGVYKRHILEKEGKGKSTSSQRPKVYVATPPENGWKGGHPRDNGCKHAK